MIINQPLNLLPSSLIGFSLICILRSIQLLSPSVEIDTCKIGYLGVSLHLACAYSTKTFTSASRWNPNLIISSS